MKLKELLKTISIDECVEIWGTTQYWGNDGTSKAYDRFEFHEPLQWVTDAEETLPDYILDDDVLFLKTRFDPKRGRIIDICISLISRTED